MTNSTTIEKLTSENKELRELVDHLLGKVRWWEQWAEDYGPGPIRRISIAIREKLRLVLKMRGAA